MFHYYTLDNSPLRCIFKQQITKLDLISKDHELAFRSCQEYTKRVYALILTCFEKLEHFNVIQTSIYSYPGLTVRYLPPSTFSSSTLTYLSVNVGTFTDCIYLLDGRLKRLNTFIVRIYCMGGVDLSIIQNLVGILSLFQLHK